MVLTALVTLALAAQSAQGAVLNPTSTQLRSASWLQPCKACEWGMRYLQDLVANPHNRDVLESLADSTMCGPLDTRTRDECESYIHVGLDRMISYFEDFVSPADVCRPLCPAADHAMPVVAAPRAGASVRDVECPFCLYAAGQAQAALRNTTVQSEVVHEMEAACRDLPAMFADTCVRYVDEQGPFIISMLETMTPEQLCDVLGACSQAGWLQAAGSAAMPDALRLRLARAAATLGSMQLGDVCRPSTGPVLLRGAAVVEASESCQICKIAILEVHAKVADPAFQAAVVAYMKQLCHKASDFEEQCIETVQQYAPLAFTVLLSYLQPDSFCVLVHMCDNPYPPPPVALA